jgi:hypothetical protein
MSALTKISLMGLIAGSVFMGKAYALPMYASSVVYFDASGHVIGQTVHYCNNISKHAGTINGQYYRTDTFLCGAGSSDYSNIRGLQCDASDNCHEVLLSAPPGGVAEEYNLPAGMTVQQSCQIARCPAPGEPEPSELPGLGVWYSF